MNRSIVEALAGLLLLSDVTSARAQELGTAEQAKAMLGRAIAALKSNEATALSEFNDPNNKEFHDRDLYVFCFRMSDGKITAYSSPGLLGIGIRTLSLKEDPIGQRAYDGVQNSPPGNIATIDYSFPKPGRTESVPKQFLETRIDSEACGVAYYK